MRIDGYYNRDQTGTGQGRSLMAFLRAKRPLNSVPVACILTKYGLNCSI